MINGFSAYGLRLTAYVNSEWKMVNGKWKKLIGRLTEVIKLTNKGVFPNISLHLV